MADGTCTACKFPDEPHSCPTTAESPKQSQHSKSSQEGLGQAKKALVALQRLQDLLPARVRASVAKEAYAALSQRDLFEDLRQATERKASCAWAKHQGPRMLEHSLYIYTYIFYIQIHTYVYKYDIYVL